MTICGVSVIDFDRALAWCDSEIFDGGEPAGDFDKVLVGALAGIIGTATGPLALFDAAGEALRRAADFDAAALSLPAILRACGICTRIAARGPAPLWSAVAIAGFSRRYGRVVATVFDQADEFRPHLRLDFAAPWRPGVAPTDLHSVVAAAGEQLIELRQQNPSATGARLVLAELRAGAITVRPIFQLRPALRRPDAPAADLATPPPATFPIVGNGLSPR